MSQQRRFTELLAQVAREVTVRQAADVCCGDLTLEQYQTLQEISAAAVSTIGTLSSRLRVDLSTMSRNVTVLERNGYLDRARSAEDGRVVNVRLTAKGRRALETLCCDEREVLGDVYAKLPEGERSRTIRALEVLQGCLERTQPGAACCSSPPARKGAS